MSCNGCRVLRKGCSETCILRPCLQWIESAESQGHATVFVAKFFGRAGLMSFISAVPELHRPGTTSFFIRLQLTHAHLYLIPKYITVTLIQSLQTIRLQTLRSIRLFMFLIFNCFFLLFVCSALFQSLLFEACGRTVNPVNGAVGMLWTGNWHVCQAAVETVLRGGTLRPISDLLESPSLLMISSDESSEIWHQEVSRNENNQNHHRRFSTTRSKTEMMKESLVNRKRLKSASDLDLQVNHGLTLTNLAVPATLFPPLPFCKAVNGDRPGSPSEESVTTSCWENGMRGDKYRRNKEEKKLLNLFV